MPQDTLSQTRWEVRIDLHMCVTAHLYSNTLMHAHIRALTRKYTHKDIFKFSISQLWSVRLFIYLTTVKLSFSGFRNGAILNSWSVGGAITHDGNHTQKVPRKVLCVPEPQDTCISHLDCQSPSAVSNFQPTGRALGLTHSTPAPLWPHAAVLHCLVSAEMPLPPASSFCLL